MQETEVGRKILASRDARREPTEENPQANDRVDDKSEDEDVEIKEAEEDANRGHKHKVEESAIAEAAEIKKRRLNAAELAKKVHRKLNICRAMRASDRRKLEMIVRNITGENECEDGDNTIVS